MEHWVEVNLFGPRKFQDEILLITLRPYARRLDRRGVLLTFHYFREPEIRFRVRLKSSGEMRRQAAAIAAIARTLEGKGMLSKWSFGSHGQEGVAYVGEEDRYGKMGWKVAQEYFRAGSETALSLLALESESLLENPLWGEGLGNPWEGGESNPWMGQRLGPLEFHWSRYVHLFSNQLGFDIPSEVELCARQAATYKRVHREVGMEW